MADKYKMGRFGLGCIKTANKAFLQAAVEIIKKVDNQLVEVPIQKGGKDGQTAE